MKLSTIGLNFIFVISTLFGCTSETAIIRRSQLADPMETGQIIVLMNNGARYTLNNYQVTDSILVGAGYAAPSGAMFKGELKLTDISYISTRNTSTFKTLLAIGLVVGFVGLSDSFMGSDVTGLTVKEVDGFYYPSSGGGPISCPFIYTWDGSVYHFESETFAGAVFKGAERSSYDVLRHLRPSGGVYTLRITNERPETEYTNEIKLLAIDAPVGVGVIADARGRIHTIGVPEHPLLCVDFEGEDAGARVNSADGLFWESNLNGKDFAKEEDLKDGLVLEFRKPENAASAKLLVRGINTDLGGFAFKQLFSLSGPNFLEMYRQLESDPSFGKKMLGFMMREGMLHVKVWRDRAWVNAGALPDVGPLLCKEQIVLLDTRGIRGNTLRIRLESSLDLWKIDRVAVDYTPDQAVAVRELEPRSAFNETGLDIADCLRADDTSYYATVPGDYADVTFEEVSPGKGMDRWYVLRTKGYYHIWPSPGVTDRREIVEKILTEPFFGNKMYMPVWKDVKERSH